MLSKEDAVAQRERSIANTVRDALVSAHRLRNHAWTTIEIRIRLSQINVDKRVAPAIRCRQLSRACFFLFPFFCFFQNEKRNVSNREIIVESVTGGGEPRKRISTGQ